MTQDQLTTLAAAGYNRVPIAREILADLDTPLSTFIKLAQGPYSYLFESVQGGEKWGRYSIIGLPCQERIEISGHTFRHIHQEQVIATYESDDPLAEVEAFRNRFKVAPIDGLPKFTGGLVGYFGHDTIRYIEPRLDGVDHEDTLQVPDILLMVSEQVVVFDNLSGKLQLITHADPSQPDALIQAQERLDALEIRLRTSIANATSPGTGRPPLEESDFQSGFTEKGFQQAVARIKDYILAGDIMQCVLSQRMSVPFSAEPLDLYRALRSLNPSPYMFHIHLDHFQVVGASPEILTRMEDGEITVRPLAGTRKRGHSEAEDQALETELLADPKERAEHVMLIDLGRNDIGRVSQTGSVQVTDQMAVERYSHVMHIVSNVTGQLKPDLGPLDALKATFPAGTLSGAPKIRALEILDELEPVKRGVYGGAVGYIGWNGNIDTAIAIRTAVIKDGQLHIQAGAGIVADSDPQMEWEETMNKGRALFRAVAMVEKGLDNL